MATERDSVIGWYMMLCTAFGVAVGLIGLGFGLVFLSPLQGFGVGLLSFGIGLAYGFLFSSRRIFRVILITVREMASEEALSKKPEVQWKIIDRHRGGFSCVDERDWVIWNDRLFDDVLKVASDKAKSRNQPVCVLYCSEEMNGDICPRAPFGPERLPVHDD